jgi:hypothetical protein
MLFLVFERVVCTYLVGLIPRLDLVLERRLLLSLWKPHLVSACVFNDDRARQTYSLCAGCGRLHRNTATSFWSKAALEF